MTILLWAMALLSLERLVYIWLCWGPASFVALCRVPWSGATVDPVAAVEGLFCLFKAIQLGVFFWWCFAFGDGRLWPSGGPIVVAFGALLVGGGQLLNALVFRRLGRSGVFYGGQLGLEVGWHAGFPFSWFRHPQYVGAVMTVWGLFLIARYPAPDWSWLPILETTYYWLSTRLERYAHAGSSLSLASEN